MDTVKPTTPVTPATGACGTLTPVIHVGVFDLHPDEVAGREDSETDETPREGIMRFRVSSTVRFRPPFASTRQPLKEMICHG